MLKTSPNGFVISWRILLGVLIFTLLTIPSNVYKLPGQLPFDLEIYRIVAFFVFLLWTVALLIDPTAKLRRSPVDLHLSLLLTAVCVSLLVNQASHSQGGEPYEGLKAAILFVSYLLVFYFVVSTFRESADATAALKFIVLLGAVVSMFGVIERVANYNLFYHLHEWIPILTKTGDRDAMVRGGLRIAGSLSHPIAFSAILAMIFPLGVHFWQAARDSAARTIFAFATGLLVTALMLTGSRTGFVALAAAVIVLFVGRRQWRKIIIVALLVFFFLIHMLFPGALGTIKRTLSWSHIQKVEIGNEAGRIEDYPKIYAEFVKRPLFGLGYYAFRPQRYFFVDNQYLKFLVEIGLAGTLAVLALFYRLFAEMWRAAKSPGSQDPSLPLSIAASSIAFMTATATFDTFGFSQVPYLFFIISALGIAYVQNTKNDSAGGSLPVVGGHLDG